MKSIYSELSGVQIFSCLDYEDVTVRTLQRAGVLFSFFEKMLSLNLDWLCHVLIMEFPSSV